MTTEILNKYNKSKQIHFDSNTHTIVKAQSSILRLQREQKKIKLYEHTYSQQLIKITFITKLYSTKDKK